jgi:tetratricopeptide (TPR) repeat protein
LEYIAEILFVNWRSVCLAVASAIWLSSAALADKTTFVAGEGYHRTVPLYVDGTKVWKEPGSSVSEAQLKSIVEKSKQDAVSYPVALTNLANFYSSRSEYEKAESIYWDALKCRADAKPPSSADIAAAYHNLGALLEFRKQPTMAENVYKRAIAEWEQGGPAQKGNLASELSNLGEFYFKNKRLALAESTLRRSLALLDQQKRTDGVTLEVLENLSLVLEDAGKSLEAKKCIRRIQSLKGQSAPGKQGARTKGGAGAR